MPASVRIQLGAALPARGTIALDAAARGVIRRAVRALLRHESVRDAEISITLLDDDEIASMNADFLSHDGPTDVIAFALFDDGEPPLGDIYIGYDQALRQADANDIPLTEELARLAVHGVLHVLGYDHPAGRERLGSKMWQIQETIVSQVFA